MIDESQQYIGSGVDGFTRSIDEFFSDEKIEYEANKSYLRVTGDMIMSEGGETGFVGTAKGKIHLPNTQRKLKLVFESDPDEERDDLERKLDNNPLDAAQDKSFFAGIEGLWGEFKYWKLRPGIGLKMNSHLEIYVRVRANRTYNISDMWQAYLRNTLYQYSSSGSSFKTSLEFDRKIGDSLLFRSTTSGQWEEETDLWELNNLFSLTHSIDEKRALIYQAGIYGESEPRVFATDYLLQLRYRKLIYSDYLFLELSPKVVYKREDNFEASHSFIIRGEIVFKG